MEWNGRRDERKARRTSPLSQPPLSSPFSVPSQVCPFGLYAEQINGTPFTVPRRANLRTWMYRIRPSVTHEPFHPLDFAAEALTADFAHAPLTPNQMRWRPFAIPTDPVDWVRGLFTVAGAGSAGSPSGGYAIHVYAASADMGDSCLGNADGDFLIVPQQGRLAITTELGRMSLAPGEVAILPRGLRFSVALPDGTARGYVLEVFGGHFQLPDLGPIGANGLSSPRDWASPAAWFEDRECEYTVLHKLGGSLFAARQAFSPFNVVAWHGNYAPSKYDLARFCPVGSVSFDHPDPSIFTVLTVPSPAPGVALADFVLFPPRWAVADGTFRPPYYHRNVMNEFMGLIRGAYEAKAVSEFAPGGASLHLAMTPHGPDAGTFEAATAPGASDAPARLPSDTLAFMFETHAPPRVTAAALASPHVDRGYYRCWAGLKSHFDAEGAARAVAEAKAKSGGGSGGAAPSNGEAKKAEEPALAAI